MPACSLTLEFLFFPLFLQPLNETPGIILTSFKDVFNLYPAPSNGILILFSAVQTTFLFVLNTSEEMATHSSVLAWRVLGTGEPGRLPSVGSHRVGHD